MRINEVNLNDRNDLTFRFRSADKLLEYGELENLEIYFCPFEQEDDVLEGELNLYWQSYVPYLTQADMYYQHRIFVSFNEVSVYS